MKPIVIDLFCGLGGWADGFLAGGYTCYGFDVERHDYGTGGYPGQLILQDVRTIHGSQFRNAACIVASPPCQEFSYLAMPWSRGKQIAKALRGEGEFPEGYRGSRTIAEMTALFDACFRIQREACEAAGRYIPMVVENVRGAEPWVGKAKANYGSFYLWGDVGMVGNRVVCRAEFGNYAAPMKAQKVPGLNFHEHDKTGKPGRSFQSAAVKAMGGFHGPSHPDGKGKRDLGGPNDPRRFSSRSSARKAASAQIAKIPFGLSSYVARCFWPAGVERVA